MLYILSQPVCHSSNLNHLKLSESTREKKENIRSESEYVKRREESDFLKKNCRQEKDTRVHLFFSYNSDIILPQSSASSSTFVPNQFTETIHFSSLPFSLPLPFLLLLLLLLLLLFAPLVSFLR